MYYRKKGVDSLLNFLSDSEIPQGALSIETPAGSLVVFEAAGFHKAGDVQSGTERMVIRGHSYLDASRLGAASGAFS